MPDVDCTTDRLVFDLQYHDIGGIWTQTIDACKLHEGLEVTTRFDVWIARRLEDGYFLDGRDFCTILCKTSGRSRHTYFLTLDMAKHLSMMERSPKGQQARQYFIDCEKAFSHMSGTVVKMLEQFGERLSALESSRNAVDSRQASLVPPSHHLPPPPRYPMQEKPHVSEHLIAVWTTLRQAEIPMSNAEIMAANRMKEGVTRKWTRYLVHIGLVDLFETAPAHLFVVAEHADKRHAGYFQHLERIAQLMEQRQRRLFT